MRWKTLLFVFGMLLVVACSGSSGTESIPLNPLEPVSYTHLTLPTTPYV